MEKLRELESGFVEVDETNTLHEEAKQRQKPMNGQDKKDEVLENSME